MSISLFPLSFELNAWNFAFLLMLMHMITPFLLRFRQNKNVTFWIYFLQPNGHLILYKFFISIYPCDFEIVDFDTWKNVLVFCQKNYFDIDITDISQITWTFFNQIWYKKSVLHALKAISVFSTVFLFMRTNKSCRFVLTTNGGTRDGSRWYNII